VLARCDRRVQFTESRRWLFFSLIMFLARLWSRPLLEVSLKVFTQGCREYEGLQSVFDAILRFFVAGRYVLGIFIENLLISGDY